MLAPWIVLINLGLPSSSSNFSSADFSLTFLDSAERWSWISSFCKLDSAIATVSLVPVLSDDSTTLWLTDSDDFCETVSEDCWEASTDAFWTVASEAVWETLSDITSDFDSIFELSVDSLAYDSDFASFEEYDSEMAPDSLIADWLEIFTDDTSSEIINVVLELKILWTSNYVTIFWRWRLRYWSNQNSDWVT